MLGRVARGTCYSLPSNLRPLGKGPPFQMRFAVLKKSMTSQRKERNSKHACMQPLLLLSKSKITRPSCDVGLEPDTAVLCSYYLCVSTYYQARRQCSQWWVEVPKRSWYSVVCGGRSGYGIIMYICTYILHTYICMYVGTSPHAQWLGRERRLHERARNDVCRRLFSKPMQGRPFEVSASRLSNGGWKGELLIL